MDNDDDDIFRDEDCWLSEMALVLSGFHSVGSFVLESKMLEKDLEFFLSSRSRIEEVVDGEKGGMVVLEQVLFFKTFLTWSRQVNTLLKFFP
jgi:hypothetical protein